MKEKGQALVEFILILPLIILILVCLIDIGNIYIEKYNLTNDLDTVTELYQNKQENELKTYIAQKHLIYQDTKENTLTKIAIKKQLDITSPLLKKALGKKYTIEIDRTIYNE